LKPDELLGSSRKVIVLTSFGDLSKLELIIHLSNYIKSMKDVCENLLLIDVRNTRTFVNNMKKLGGVKKASVIVGFLSTDNPLRLVVSEYFPSLFQDKEKLYIGVSFYCPDKLNFRDFSAVEDALFSELKRQGVKKAKIVKRNSLYEVYSISISRRGITEFIVFPLDHMLGLATTIFTPDIHDIEERSAGKPINIPEISTPPTLARTLVNISGLRPSQTLLDPFCGTGSILIEALIKGINCIGVDINRKYVEYTKRNLQWAIERYKISNIRYSILKGDARHLERIITREVIDSVVTEPILLPTMRSKPRSPFIKPIMKRAEDTYVKAIDSVSNIIRVGGKIVIVAPIVKTSDGETLRLNLIERIPDRLKISETNPLIRVNNPIKFTGQTTRWLKREVYIFERTK